MRGEHIELLGVVSLIARLSGKQLEARPLQTVRLLVQPALECLRRELTLRLKLGSRERDLDVRERDLDLMLEISSHQSAAASDTDEFGLIMKTALERMGCALAALWVPDKNIALSLTRSGQPMSAERCWNIDWSTGPGPAPATGSRSDPAWPGSISGPSA